MWKIVSASVQGRSHIDEGIPCQDANAWKSGKDWFAGIVSDGAGSSNSSEIGSQHIADSVVSSIEEIIEDVNSDNFLEYLKEKIADAIRQARELLAVKAEVSIEQLNDYNATLVGAVIKGDKGLFFHIGDGLAMGFPTGTWQADVKSLPENGEYANETFFFTQPNWEDHLRFTEISGDLDLILLMSDGAMSFTMSKDKKGVDARFMEPVNKYLNSVDAAHGSNALAGTLASPKTDHITGDDKTLLWAFQS